MLKEPATILIGFSGRLLLEAKLRMFFMGLELDSRSIRQRSLFFKVWRARIGGIGLLSWLQKNMRLQKEIEKLEAKVNKEKLEIMQRELKVQQRYESEIEQRRIQFVQMGDGGNMARSWVLNMPE